MLKVGTYIAVFVAISIYFLKFHNKKHLPPVYDGIYLQEFGRVADIFREQVTNGKELGGSFAAYYKGRLVVDLWGGYADIESEQKWRNDTLPITYSTTKGIVSILAAKMVDQGLLDYQSLVTKYWPEFGANGKDNITVDMLMSHTGGLSYLDKPISLLELHHNPEKVEKELAKENPKWPPGTEHSYHAMTFGAYVDRVLSRADPKKRRIDQLFREEISVPFGIDFHIGLPRSEAYRAARFVPIDVAEFMWNMAKEPSMWNVLMTMMFDPRSRLIKASKAMKEQVTNDPYIREVSISSSNGHGTARSMAKLYGILANGGKINGKEFISKKTLDAFTKPKNLGYGPDFGSEVVMGRGVFYYKNPKNELVYGHPGYGGQMAYADPINNVAVTYLTNDLSVFGFGNDPKFKALEKELYSCLQDIKSSDLSSKYHTMS